jgi:thiamine-phosphate pyrophosphorylase
MSRNEKLNGLYVITDDVLTPNETIYEQVQNALEGGAKIVQLRDKISNEEKIKIKVKHLQNLCKKYDALFVLNDKVDLAMELQCDGLHIGKSDYHRFDEIRQNYKGIIGVSCYGDVDKAKEFETKGADYVAFGSFFHSPTKPNSNIVSMDVIEKAKEKLTIPVCVIGGININNLTQIISSKPHMVSVISDIWKSENIKDKAMQYTYKLGEIE